MSRRPTILGQRRWIGVGILVGLALGQAATMVVTAFATRDVFMFLRDGTTAPPLGALFAIAAAGSILFALRAFEGKVAERTGQSYAADIREALFKHITRMPTSAIARRRSGALALRYVGDLTAFKGWVSRGLARLISASITIPAAFLVLYILEPWLFLAALVPIAAVMIGIVLLGSPLGMAHAELRSKRARLAASMAERLPQGIALRRSGRIKTELKLLSRKSEEIIDAAVHRASLAATVRALPDAGSGIASAICLYVCMQLNLGIPDAVAALTALALVVWPLRHLADVTDRRRAYVVASDKLDMLMTAPRLPVHKKVKAVREQPAILIRSTVLPGLQPLDAKLSRSTLSRLDGPEGCGKSTLLLALAGFETQPPARQFTVLGVNPVALRTGQVLYLGRHTPQLKGSLRRDATLGIGRSVTDTEIIGALHDAGLQDMLARIGGLDGKIAEGRRNLTASEQIRIHLARALLSRPELALIDADEIGLDGDNLMQLLDYMDRINAAGLIVTSDPTALDRLTASFQMRTAKEKGDNGRETVPGRDDVSVTGATS